ncbi:MAG TPA: PEP-utilizing enzyme, partial [Acidimicrobiales bacterium]
SAGTVVSPGTAKGPLLHLADTEELTKLSVAPIISVNFRADAPQSAYIAELQARIRALPTKPIIHVRRPYVVLSLLIGDVAGFVFDGGSLLCHLAILLREAGTPAVITTEPLTEADLQLALISNGTIAINSESDGKGSYGNPYDPHDW